MSRQLRFGALATSGPRPRRRQEEHPRPRRPRPAGEPTIRRRPGADRTGRHHRLPLRPTPAAPVGGPPSGVEQRRHPDADTAQLGRSVSRAASRVPGVRDVRPVTIRADERSVGLDLDLITEYGHSVPAVADAVRRAVADQVYADTGHTVATVTITVRDLVLPGSADATPHPPVARQELTMATVNRVASSLLAVALLVGGVLLTAQALLATMSRPTPPLVRPGWYETLTTTRWADPGVRAVAGLTVLLGLAVLAAELRRWTPVRLRVDDHDGWHLRRRCVERRLTDAVDTVPGVHRARVRLRRHRDRWRPRLRAAGDPAARAEVEFAMRHEWRRLTRPRVDRAEIRLLPSRWAA